MGGVNGATSFNSMDYDSSTQAYVLAGQSADTSIVSSQSPLAISLDANNYVLWAIQYIKSGYNKLSDIKVIQNGGKAIIVFDLTSAAGPLTLAYIDMSNGLILSSFYESSAPTGFIAMQGSFFVDLNEYLYLSYYISSSWRVIQYDLNAQSIKYQLSFPAEQCSSVETNDYLTMFIGGQALPSPNGGLLLQIDTMTGVVQQSLSLVNTVDTNYYIISRMYHDISNVILHICYEKTPSTGSLLLVQHDITNAVTLYSYEYAPFSVTLTCSGIFGSGSNSYFYIQQNDGYAYLLHANFGGNTYVLTYLSSASSSMTINFALIYSATSGYMVGSSTSFSDVLFPQSYSQTQGFLLPLNGDQSCFTYSTATDSVAMVNYGMVQTPISLTQGMSTLSFIIDLIGSAIITSTSSNSLSWCTYQKQIVPPSHTNQSIYVNQAQTTYVAPVCTFGLTCTDVVFIYSASLVGGVALPGFISFTASSRQFKLYSTSLTDSGSYTIQYNCTVTGDDSYNTSTFVVDVQNCSSQVFTNGTTAGMLYNIDEVSTSFTLTDFNLSAGYCTAINYTLVDQTGILDFTVFTWSSSTPLKLIIYTNDTSKIGTYIFSFTAALVDCPTVTATSIFTVQILASCSTAIVIQSGVGYVTNYYFDIEVNGLVQFDAPISYNLSIANCLNVSYYILNSDRSTVDPSIFSIDSTGVAHINACSTTPLGTYTIIYGATNGYSFKEISTVLYVVDCYSIYLPLTTFNIPLAPVQYIVGDPSTYFPAAWLSVTLPSSCGSIEYSYNADHYPTGAGYFYLTVSGNTPEVQVYTSTVTDAGVYNVNVYASLANKNYQSSPGVLQITIIDPCTYGEFTNPTVYNQTYNLRSGSVVIQLDPFVPGISDTICGTTTYQLTYNDNVTSPDSSVFTFDSSSSPITLTILSSDYTKAGIYYFNYASYQGTYKSEMAYVTFQIEIIDLCLSTIITQPSNDTLYYSIPLTTVSSAFAAWTSSESGCGNFVYSCTNEDGTSFDSTVFTFSSSSIMVSAYSTDITKAGTYSLRVKGQIPYPYLTYEYAYINVSINVSCTVTVVTPYVPSSQTYIIGDPAQTISFSNWTDSVNNCGSFVYTSNSNGPTVFNATNQSFTFQTDLASKAGFYSITLVGQVGIYTTSSQSFILQVIDNCPNTVITPSVMTNYTYYVLDTALVINIGAFASSMTDYLCGAFSYSATQDGTLMNTQMFTFDPNALTLTVYTAVGSRAANYSIMITGHQGTYTSHYGTVTFNVEIVDICLGAIITNNMPSVDTFYYGLFTGVDEIAFSSFSENYGFCGDFTYNATYSNGTILDSDIISFDASTVTFTLNSTDLSKVGTTTILLTGQLPGSYPYSSYSFTLIVGCFTESVGGTSPYIALSQLYQIGELQQSLTFGALYQTPACEYNFTYTALQSDGTALPSFIKFYDAKRNITIFTSDNSYAGTYSVIITGTLSDSKAHTYSFYFNLMAEGTQYLFNSNPYFQTSLDSLQAVVGKGIIVYTFPDIIDPNDCTVLISSINMPSFATLSGYTLTLQATSNGQVGNYTVNIKLLETCTSANEMTYTMSIQVISSTSTINTTISTSEDSDDDESDSSDSSLTDYIGSDIQASQNTLIEDIIAKLIDLKNQSTSLSSYISQISLKGVVTIKFTEAIGIPSNYQKLNNSYLNVQYANLGENNASLISWGITEFSSTFFTIQLNFSNPLAVSQSQIIQVSYRDAQQLIGTTAALSTVSSTMSAATKTLMISNAALQFAMSASMSQLWGMINALQIITYLPAFNLLFPQNAQLLLSSFTSIAQFQPFDMTGVMDSVYKPSKSQSDNVPPNLSSIGITSTNLYVNLGLFLVSLVGIAIVSLAMLGIKKLTLQNATNCIEGYLGFCTSTLTSCQNLAFDTPYNIGQSIIAFMFLIFIVAFPPASFFFLLRFQDKLETEIYKDRCESLYENIGTTQGNGLLIMPFFLARRLVLAVNVVYMPSYVQTQLLIQTVTSLYYLRFLIFHKPYIQPILNFMEAFNECTLLISFYLCYLFTDFVPLQEMRYKLGWAFVALLLVNTLVNMVGLFISTVITLRRLIMKIRQRCKANNQSKVQNMPNNKNDLHYKNLNNSLSEQSILRQTKLLEIRNNVLQAQANKSKLIEQTPLNKYTTSNTNLNNTSQTEQQFGDRTQSNMNLGMTQMNDMSYDDITIFHEDNFDDVANSANNSPVQRRIAQNYLSNDFQITNL